MKQILKYTALGILVVAVVSFVVDWGVWRARVAGGGGMGTVQVTWFQVASLKGGKEDYYPDGNGPVTCSESVYPQGGVKPCWWVERNPVVFER